jgi:spermidine/putrescine transport system ATP-binding protein
MALLELRHVTRRFDGVAAVDNVSLAIESGEFFTLLGPSGCGKTTILRMIAGFDLPDAGSIFLDGADLADTPPEKRPIHTVFQSYALFPHLSVAGNIAFPLRMAGKHRAEVDQLTSEALESVHLTDKSGAYPHELSGGQKQRVALARGLVNRPRLLLLDEPLGALDAKLREEMQLDLIKLQREAGITFVFVTHAQTEALALSHRIAVMNAGRVEQFGEPSKIYGMPENRFVAGFIGKCNMLDAEVREATPHLLRLDCRGLGEVSAPARPGAAAGLRGVLALRPEQVRIGAADAVQELKNHFEIGRAHV